MKKVFYFLIFVLVIIYSCDNESEEKLSPLDNYYVRLLSEKPDMEIEVLKCDKPWEVKFLNYTCMVSLPDKYVMYYIVYTGLSYLTCYAESVDGINWIKPNLGICEFNGNTENNIISYHFYAISVTYHDEFFFLLAQVGDNLYLYKSEDGKSFERLNSFSIPYYCDSQNQIVYDPMADTYKFYLRSWYKSTNQNINYNHTDAFYRSVSYLESKSPETVNIEMSDNPLWKWGAERMPALSNELPVIIKNKSDDDYDVYNACVHRYDDGTFIAYPNLYWHLPEPPKGGKYYNDGYTRLGMLYSVDGKEFVTITNDYFNYGGYFFLFIPGHVETNSKLIHYYVNFTNTHGDAYKNKNAIIARIHIKK